jgi:hypothetical protein
MKNLHALSPAIFLQTPSVYLQDAIRALHFNVGGTKRL